MIDWPLKLMVIERKKADRLFLFDLGTDPGRDETTSLDGQRPDDLQRALRRASRRFEAARSTREPTPWRIMTDFGSPSESVHDPAPVAIRVLLGVGFAAGVSGAGRCSWCTRRRHAPPSSRAAPRRRWCRRRPAARVAPHAGQALADRLAPAREPGGDRRRRGQPRRLRRRHGRGQGPDEARPVAERLLRPQLGRGAAEDHLHKWINREYPERCAEFDRDKWLAISKELPTKPMQLLHGPLRVPEPEGRVPGHHGELVRGATTLCADEGKRLCNEDEWTFACEGEEATPYPYGYARDATACVIDQHWRPFDEAAMRPRDGDDGDGRARPALAGRAVGLAAALQEPLRRLRHDRQRRRVDAARRATASARASSRAATGARSARAAGPATRAHDENHMFYQQGFRCCADVRRPPGAQDVLGGPVARAAARAASLDVSVNRGRPTLDPPRPGRDRRPAAARKRRAGSAALPRQSPRIRSVARQPRSRPTRPRRCPSRARRVDGHGCSSRGRGAFAARGAGAAAAAGMPRAGRAIPQPPIERRRAPAEKDPSRGWCRSPTTTRTATSRTSPSSSATTPTACGRANDRPRNERDRRIRRAAGQPANLEDGARGCPQARSQLSQRPATGGARGRHGQEGRPGDGRPRAWATGR